MTDRVPTDESDGLPAGLAQPALRALRNAGITRLDQLVTCTEADLNSLHGIGPKATRTLDAALRARGLAFAGSGR